MRYKEQRGGNEFIKDNLYCCCCFVVVVDDDDDDENDDDDDDDDYYINLHGIGTNAHVADVFRTRFKLHPSMHPRQIT